MPHCEPYLPHGDNSLQLFAVTVDIRNRARLAFDYPVGQRGSALPVGVVSHAMMVKVAGGS